MSTFMNAVLNQEARTANGMKALKSTGSALVDLFYNIGAMRGNDIIPLFIAAYVENSNLATRIALWARDIRGGAGERKIFRDIFKYLSLTNTELALKVLPKIPELGRWDDLLFAEGEVRKHAFDLIFEGLRNKNTRGLVCKWLPRKGLVAIELRKAFGLTPKQYRKMLVHGTDVVEQLMCAKRWNEIDYNKVPSLASARYKKAFNRHSVNYAEYVKKLVSGDETVKVNSAAVYPYDVLKGFVNYWGKKEFSQTEKDHILAQWNALPDYANGKNILPLVDVSGSMTAPIPGNSKLCFLDVAVSLGLYFADKNKGKFKDMFLPFSSKSELILLRGDIIQKVEQMIKSSWSMSTNLHAALDTILSVAVKSNVPQEEMPETLVILSDMQFNACISFDFSAYEMIRHKYNSAGYRLPNIVFWNLNAKYGNQPVSKNELGVSLISGFSPNIIKNLNDLSELSPENMMMKVITNPRYDYL